MKVRQELLRHADVSTTLNIYTQTVSQQKRDAASKSRGCFCTGKKKKGRATGPSLYQVVLV